MNPHAMEPFGKALLAYYEGEAEVRLTVRRDDGVEVHLPARYFFREEASFTEIEMKALTLCKGRILDVGAGSGLHSLVLQVRGYQITSIDISPEAVTVTRRRGVKDAHCADVFLSRNGRFDTLLFLGHGIGMVETLDGLDRFLGRMAGLLSEDGQVLLDSLDVGVTNNPINLTYHEMNRKGGRYAGEIQMQLEFHGVKGPFCGWLQVDVEILAKHAKAKGWRCEIIHREPAGDYLARPSRIG